MQVPGLLTSAAVFRCASVLLHCMCMLRRMRPAYTQSICMAAYGEARRCSRWSHNFSVSAIQACRSSALTLTESGLRGFPV